jgi:hypothetical protein
MFGLLRIEFRLLPHQIRDLSFERGNPLLKVCIRRLKGRL